MAMTFDEAAKSLTDDEREIARVIWDHVAEPDGTLATGGCQPFYSVEQWRERGEELGGDPRLVIVYDGVAVLRDAAESGLHSLLAPFDAYVEPCTHWHAAVYTPWDL